MGLTQIFKDAERFWYVSVNPFYIAVIKLLAVFSVPVFFVPSFFVSSYEIWALAGYLVMVNEMCKIVLLLLFRLSDFLGSLKI